MFIIKQNIRQEIPIGYIQTTLLVAFKRIKWNSIFDLFSFVHFGIKLSLTDIHSFRSLLTYPQAVFGLYCCIYFVHKIVFEFSYMLRQSKHFRTKKYILIIGIWMSKLVYTVLYLHAVSIYFYEYIHSKFIEKRLYWHVNAKNFIWQK